MVYQSAELEMNPVSGAEQFSYRTRARAAGQKLVEAVQAVLPGLAGRAGEVEALGAAFLPGSDGHAHHPTAQGEAFGSLHVQCLLGLPPEPFDEGRMQSLLTHA